LKRKLKYIFFIILLVIALFIFTDIYKVFLPPLEVGEYIAPNYGDVILVLGGGLKTGYQIGYSTEERLNLAVELYRQKKRTIFVSDGSLYRGSPAIKKMVDFLLSKGVERNHIKYEGKSQTTYDNLLFARDLSEKKYAREIIVCTSPYHQKRALLMLSHLKLKSFKIARMDKSEIHYPGTISRRLRNIRLIVREYFAILKFKVLKK